MSTFISILALKLLLVHPFHVSVCDMVYEKKDKHLKISVRLFLDDLEAAIRMQTGDEKYDITDTVRWKETQSLLKDYFGETLAVSVKNKPLELVYLGSEVEMDAMWCYLEVVKLKPFEQITVRYEALMEVFDDQENLVHVRLDGDVRSCRMFGMNIENELTWN